jgi:cytochrome c oxidase assembly factor CtaG
MRLAAGVVTVKCPFPFMIRFLSSFQAQAIAGRPVSPASQIESYILGFQVLNKFKRFKREEENGYPYFVFQWDFGF